MLVGLTSMEGVERMNIVMVYLQQWAGFMLRHNSYTMDINQERNYYSCRDFGYLAGNCINWEIIEQRRRIEYGNSSNNRDNWKEEESLVVLN